MLPAQLGARMACGHICELTHFKIHGLVASVLVTGDSLLYVHQNPREPKFVPGDRTPPPHKIKQISFLKLSLVSHTKFADTVTKSVLEVTILKAGLFILLQNTPRL
jgi:hypothetical protein